MDNEANSKKNSFSRVAVERLRRKPAKANEGVGILPSEMLEGKKRTRRRSIGRADQTKALLMEVLLWLNEVTQPRGYPGITSSDLVSNFWFFFVQQNTQKKNKEKACSFNTEWFCMSCFFLGVLCFCFFKKVGKKREFKKKKNRPQNCSNEREVKKRCSRKRKTRTGSSQKITGTESED